MDEHLARERHACGESATLPLQLLLIALEFAPDGQSHPLEVATRLRCGLERDHSGPHHDFVRELDGVDPGEVWARWRSGQDPGSIAALPDCEAVNGLPAGRDDACVLYAGHPGGHSFSYADPEYTEYTARDDGHAA
ncbi:hypothetical protein GCM10010232_64640 [Streptomyces amakusaensis]|uniref:Uncharacterized protein n=1 Tax=Streptomyces amakusaensis TaxID=67271 RepID=A0ABW0AVC0_9ACTN